MVALLKGQKVITKDGECVVEIKLDLNINLSSDALQVTVAGQPASSATQKQQEEEEVDWAIPSFKKPKKDKKFKFGKTVE